MYFALIIVKISRRFININILCVNEWILLGFNRHGKFFRFTIFGRVFSNISRISKRIVKKLLHNKSKLGKQRIKAKRRTSRRKSK